jgi:hypothetical protein
MDADDVEKTIGLFSSKIWYIRKCTQVEEFST